jgi:hypothetical protein
VKTVHFHPATGNLAHWLTRHGSPTIYRCFALPQLLYRWRHQSGVFWIHPRITDESNHENCQEIPCLFGTRKLITMLIKAINCSYTEPVKSSPHTIWLLSYLHKGLQSGLNLSIVLFHELANTGYGRLANKLENQFQSLLFTAKKQTCSWISSSIRHQLSLTLSHSHCIVIRIDFF